MIPSLQPDLEDPELVRMKAIKARQKEFSERLQQVSQLRAPLVAMICCCRLQRHCC
jgi:hypothetical protein